MKTIAMVERFMTPPIVKTLLGLCLNYAVASVLRLLGFAFMFTAAYPCLGNAAFCMVNVQKEEKFSFRAKQSRADLNYA
jgi:hypothetical protein